MFSLLVNVFKRALVYTCLILTLFSSVSNAAIPAIYWVGAAIVHLLPIGVYIIMRKPEPVKQITTINHDTESVVVEIDLATIPKDAFDAGQLNTEKRMDYTGSATITADQLAQYAGKDNALYAELRPDDLWWFDSGDEQYQDVYSDPVPRELVCNVISMAPSSQLGDYFVQSYTKNVCTVLSGCIPSLNVVWFSVSAQSTVNGTWKYYMDSTPVSNIDLQNYINANNGLYPGTFYGSDGLVYQMVGRYYNTNNFLYCGLTAGDPGHLIKAGSPYPGRPGNGSTPLGALNTVLTTAPITAININKDTNFPGWYIKFDQPAFSLAAFNPSESSLSTIKNLFQARFKSFCSSLVNVKKPFDSMQFSGSSTLNFNWFGSTKTLDFAHYLVYFTAVRTLVLMFVSALFIRIVTRGD